MTRAPHASKHSWLVFCGVLGAWLVFMLLCLALSWGGSASKGKPFDLLNTSIWNMGWILWVGGTYIVRYLVTRIPIERHALARRLSTHAVCGLIVTTGVLATEYLINFIIERTWPETVLIYPPVSFVLYKFHIYYLVYWLIVGGWGAHNYYTQLQHSELTASQLETQLAQAQVQALKMQLHPHFLFNTHHSIISLMLNKDNAAAIKMLTRLSDLLRVTLKKSDHPMTSLREELEVLELYLGIQRERYRERLTVDLRIAPLALDGEVPSLLLQPLVENALEHGIDPQTSGGRLDISADVRDGSLLITIRDNGPGLPEGFSMERDEGVGLGNTRARLQRLYGGQHRFTLVPLPPPESGTEVIVMLPFRTSATTEGTPHVTASSS